MELTKEQLETVKREHPEWFREKIEAGNWYVLAGGTIVYAVRFEDENPYLNGGIFYGYGVDEEGNWRPYGLWHSTHARKATEEEVIAALDQEANKRYKVGDVVECLIDKITYTIKDLAPEEGIFSTTFRWKFTKSDEGVVIKLFDAGKWAKVIKLAKKKVEIHGCLMEHCNNFNYDEFSDKYKDPSYYKTLKLVSKDYGCRDVMLGTKHDGEEMVLFGKWDDGV